MVKQAGTAAKLALRTIRRKKGRYLAVLFIVLLSVGFLSGLKVTRAGMWDAADRYLTSQNFYDYRVFSTLGFTEDDISALEEIQGIGTAEGGYSSEELLSVDGESGDWMCLSLPDEVNLPSLTAGRMPEKDGECVGDHRAFTEDDLGKTITVESSDEDSNLNQESFVLVGLVNSPLYLSSDRTGTGEGSGTIKGFIYVSGDCFTYDAYTEADLVFDESVKTAEAAEIYSDAYDDLSDQYEDSVEEKTQELADARYEDILDEIGDEALEEEQDALDTISGQAQQAKDEAQSQVDEAVQSAKEQLDAAVAMQQMTQEQADQQLEAIRSQAQEEADEALSNISVSDIAEEAGMSAEEEQDLEDLLGTDTVESIDDLIGRQAEPLTKEEEADLASDNGVEEPEVYLLTRDENAGYVSFKSDTSIIDSIAEIFPIFFILIALLVCSATMLRMVEEERSQIGTLKALGYSSSAIAGKYLLYAGSAALFGDILGFFFGTYFLPVGFWAAYSTLYDFTELRYIFDPALFVITLLVSVFSITLSAGLACRQDLRETPAALIRPRSAKPGKRILLERIGWFWQRLSFLKKAVIRNMFRHKIRMAMMLVGIGCSSALIVIGFGIRDSMIHVGDIQYNEIQTYAMEASIDPDEAEAADVEAEIGELSGVTGTLQTEKTTVQVSSGDASMSAVSWYVFPEGTDLSGFWNLESLSDGSALSLPGDGTVLVSKRLAEKLGLTQGETFTVSNEEEETLGCGGTFVNYVNNAILQEDASLDADTILIAADGLSEDEEKALSEEIEKIDGVSAVTRLSETKKSVDNSVACLNYIIWLIVAFAGALAFVVTFNLTGINIAERSREIATVEVLGFTWKEVRYYVLRENVVLSILAGILGIPLGVLGTHAVMNRILIDTLTYPIHVEPISCILSLAVTCGFAVVVNIFMRRSIRRINMAESLKAVE